MNLNFGPRRAKVVNIKDEIQKGFSYNKSFLTDIDTFEFFDKVYRSLCAIMYNYVPGSGHPGGSISSGRFVQSLIFNTMDYDLTNPDAKDADIISYAAGHKALGLYGMWALRNEIARISKPELLPNDEKKQLRLEDLLGFRRNPTTNTPLFKKYTSKPLDGHPTPATPFVKLSTGASGVGLTASLGLTIGALDTYRDDPPKVHIVEGEGGMTPGRVSEALAAAGTMELKNAILHIDWNQASIDSDAVCREGNTPGDYVQWDPIEMCYLHDWNVIIVPDGFDFNQIFAAQQYALSLNNSQPTAIVYKTIKGWQYGITGKASHGAGHKLCSTGFYEALKPLLTDLNESLPCCEVDKTRCKSGSNSEEIESCYWAALKVIRSALEKNKDVTTKLGQQLESSKNRLLEKNRKKRTNCPDLEQIFDKNRFDPKNTPKELLLTEGSEITLRGVLGNALNYYNKISNGAFLAAAADLLGSTSTNNIAKGFANGFFHSRENPDARLLSIGGICEDAISGVLSGISTYGMHIGVGSSYGAFIAPLGHISSRLHGIGNQSKHAINPNEPYKTFILVCAHAGIKTGEDGPTHADPQCLQLLMENFPPKVMLTLTPWDPQEIWPLLTTALQLRPAVIAPFVTRPNEKIYNRSKMGLEPASNCTTGVYALKKADPASKLDGNIVLQGSGVTYAFIEETLPKIIKQGLNLNIFYVASAEIFDLLPVNEQEKIFPSTIAQDAMGITGFTLSTMYRFITSTYGRKCTMHPFQKGHYLGSGQAYKVLEEAGLDGESQFKTIMRYIKEKK